MLTGRPQGQGREAATMTSNYTTVFYGMIAADARLPADVRPVPIRRIPLEHYQVEHDVPVFSEHERTLELSDGEVVTDRYGKRELEWIVANQNRKIENTGDYVPIVIRHTENLDGSIHDAPVVGFAGPFKLGMLGAVDPKLCILAENWYIRNDMVELAAKYPRRSVELWRFGNVKERFFDPISLLGAEVPHLDLGLLYSRRGPDGPPIVCYSAAYSFSPSHEEGGGDMDGELSDQSIKQIIDAWESTDVFQWVRTKMQEEQAAEVSANMPATLAADLPPAAVAQSKAAQSQPPAAQAKPTATAYARRAAPGPAVASAVSTAPVSPRSTAPRQSVGAAEAERIKDYAISRGLRYEEAKLQIRYGEN